MKEKQKAVMKIAVASALALQMAGGTMVFAAKAFTDTQEHWAKHHIEYVAEKGILTGTETTLFSPNAAMTRGMFTTALGRLSGSNIAQSQSENAPYYAAYMAWAKDNGILNGIAEDSFLPEQPISREEMATVIANYAKYIGMTAAEGGMAMREYEDYEKISSWALSGMSYCFYAGILTGKGDGILDPQGQATRAEVSAIVHRLCDKIESEKVQ